MPVNINPMMVGTFNLVNNRLTKVANAKMITISFNIFASKRFRYFFVIIAVYISIDE
jgi:hypothetical protein